jgi:transketolase
VALVLTRQKLGFIDRAKYASASGVANGAYVLSDSPGGAPQIVLMSSGSEVALVLEAQQKLEAQGIRARVVSMPSHELFAAQSSDYQASVLPPGIKRVSAPYKQIYEHLGLTVDKLVETAAQLARSS